MAKKVEAYIKLQITAGEANPSPPVGPALGQHGVNIMEFCKAFNAATQQYGTRVSHYLLLLLFIAIVVLLLLLKHHLLHIYLKKLLVFKVAVVHLILIKLVKLHVSNLKKLRKLKMPDLTAADLEAAIRTIAGTARSMGIEVEGLE